MARPHTPARPALRKRLLTAAFAALAAAVPLSAVAQERLAEPQANIVVFESGPVLGTLLLPVGRPPSGVVVMLNDSLGPDPRSALYKDQLLGAGIAVLDVMREAPDTPSLASAIAALAADPRVATDQIGVMGFGRGARQALPVETGILAHALLYPGCDGLEDLADTEARGPLLLLHGAADEANGRDRCAAAAAAMGRNGRPVRHVTYADAGYAWDHPVYGLERRIVLPRPDGLGRIVTAPWPELATMSATQVTGFFASVFTPRAQ